MLPHDASSNSRIDCSVPKRLPRFSVCLFARSTGGARATRAHAATGGGATSAIALTTSNSGWRIEATHTDSASHSMASVKRRAEGSWRARYRDVNGREHAQHFATRRDADNWLDGVRGD